MSFVIPPCDNETYLLLDELSLVPRTEQDVIGRTLKHVARLIEEMRTMVSGEDYDKICCDLDDANAEVTKLQILLDETEKDLENERTRE